MGEDRYDLYMEYYNKDKNGNERSMLLRKIKCKDVISFLEDIERVYNKHHE
jgi:hypothetical protein